jgi:hypothetical protein
MRAWMTMTLPLVVGACAARTQPPSATAASPDPRVAALPPDPLPTPPGASPSERARNLLTSATACWFGGVWHDALGEATAAHADRCRMTLELAYGQVDPTRLERLRAAEQVEVDELGDAIARLAATDGMDADRARALRGLFDVVARAQHETLTARRAADKIKKDISGARSPAKRPQDEHDAAAPLESSSALAELLRYDAGVLGGEARAIGLLTAMNRMQMARELPKHQKVEAVSGSYELVFGVRPPAMPSDPTRSPKGGVWLAYLSKVARAAGHPVPEDASSVDDRELMAWGGTLAGLADRLRVEAPNVPQPGDLRRVVDGTVKRIDTEYRASEAAVRAKSR